LLTIPLLGGTLAGSLTGFFAQFVKGAVAVTTISDIFKNIGIAAKNLITPFLSISSLARTIGASFLFLGKILITASTYTKLFSVALTGLGFAFKALKFGAFLFLIEALIEAFKIINKEFKLTETIMNSLRTIFGSTATSLKQLFGEFELGTRLGATFALVVEGLAQSFRLLALSVVTIQKVKALGLANFKELTASKAEFFGDKETAKKARQDATDQRQRVVELTESQNQLNKSIQRGKENSERHAGAIFGETGAVRAYRREIVDGVGDLGKFQNAKKEAFSEEQSKTIDKAIENLRKQIEKLNAKRIEILDGKAAGAAAEALGEVRDLARQIVADGGANLFTEEQISKITSIKDLTEKVKAIDAKRGEQLEKLFGARSVIDVGNEKLIEQKKILEDIEKATLKLLDHLKDQGDKRENSLKTEEEMQKILLKMRNFSEGAIEFATIEAEAKKVELEAQREIEKTTKEILLLKNKISDAPLIDPKDQAKLKELEETLKFASERKRVNIQIAVQDETAKIITKNIDDISKQVTAFGRKLSVELKDNLDDIQLNDQFLKDLAIGVEFAERRRRIKEKELEIDKEAARIQKEITEKTLTSEARNALQDRLKELAEDRDRLLTVFTDKQISDQNIKIAQSLVEMNKAFQDQIVLLEERAGLFREGVLTGDFNKVTEQIDLLTNRLESLLVKRRELTLQARQPLGVEIGIIKAINDEIQNLSETLRALNFVKGIQDSLNTVADAFENAITDGVRGVIEGTKTVKELFREMGQNIFLDFAKLNAKNALDELRRGFNNLGVELSKTDFFKSIAKFFNIDLNKLNANNPLLSAQDRLGGVTALNTTATELNTTSIATLNTTIQALLLKLGGDGSIPFNTLGVKPTTFPIPDNAGGDNPLTDFASSEMFGEFTDEFVSGFEQAMQTMQNNIKTGTEALTQTGEFSFSGLFDDLGSLIETGIESIQGFFSEGGGGSEIFSKVIKGIGSLFSFGGGASKGGIIPGKPSKKDNVIMPLAAGEAVTNSDAVSFYGRNIFDALNNKSLPQDFFDNLSANGAPSLVEAASQQASSTSQQVGASTIRQVQSNERPISVTVVDKSPKLDPASFKMKPSEVTQIFVDGMRNDRVIRKVIREDLKNGGI